MQQAHLDNLVARARHFFLRWRLQRELRLAGSIALLWLFVLPLLLLLVRWLAGMTHGFQVAVSWWLVAALAVLGPMLYVLGRMAWVYAGYRPARHAGLALFDAQLDSAERLLTADEFMDAGLADSGFMQAAVDDAEKYVDKALQTSLQALPMPPWQLRPLGWLGMPLLAVVALGLSISLDGSLMQAAATSSGDSANAAEAGIPSAPDGLQRLAMRSDPRRTPQAERESSLLEKQQAAAAPSRNRLRKEESVAGQSNAASAAVAQSSSSSSSAAGQPSSQKNASKPKTQEEPARQEEIKAGTSKQREQRPQHSAQEATQASAGQGKSGSSASSAAAEFESPEQSDKSSQSLADDAQTEETEDEDEAQKSDSTVTPDLRDRKPPVDRNAFAGPTGKDPPRKTTNGRSSSVGGIKKTRGVPSMILGVPVADRIPGRSSPGRSKVTQENARASAESHPAVAAQERTARAEAAGHVEQQQLLPWMQALVRDYFKSVHE